jgi:HSP20 family molecular chaperone IbpA
MILLRRGRPASQSGSSFEVDVTFDLGPASRQQRQECTSPWRPPIEVFETAADLVVRVEIGGLSGNEVAVVVDDDLLVIRGERAFAKHGGHRLYHESRVRYGAFEASVRLPFPVDIPTTSADYLDGFLTVRLPRLAATKVETRESSGSGYAQRGGH